MFLRWVAFAFVEYLEDSCSLVPKTVFSSTETVPLPTWICCACLRSALNISVMKHHENQSRKNNAKITWLLKRPSFQGFLIKTRSTNGGTIGPVVSLQNVSGTCQPLHLGLCQVGRKEMSSNHLERRYTCMKEYISLYGPTCAVWLQTNITVDCRCNEYWNIIWQMSIHKSDCEINHWEDAHFVQLTHSSTSKAPADCLAPWGIPSKPCSLWITCVSLTIAGYPEVLWVKCTSEPRGHFYPCLQCCRTYMSASHPQLFKDHIQNKLVPGYPRQIRKLSRLISGPEPQTTGRFVIPPGIEVFESIFEYFDHRLGFLRNF